MKTCPETRNGFLVRFTNDSGFKGYEVIPCNKNEEGEKFGGRNYKIISYTYEE